MRRRLRLLLETRAVRWLALAAGCVLVGVIAVVTLGPLDMRPRTGEDAQLERFVAYLMLGGAFSVAFPRRLVQVAVILAGLAVVLEIGQGFAPYRDPRVVDAVAKVLGIVAGAALVRAVQIVVKP